MRPEKSVRIVSMGKYLPAKLESAEIERRFGIPYGWSEQNSGVAQRHHVTFESGGYMGARAIEQALERAGLKVSDLDMIISASGTFDFPLPNQASIIKSELKEKDLADVAVMDIDTTCLSFVSAFEMGARLLDGVEYKRIVIVSAEISSKGLDPENWETLTLFGDAAVAAILEFDPASKSAFIKGGQRTYSEGADFTMIQGGGNAFFFKDFPYDPKLHSFKMEGIKLLKLAKVKIPDFMNWFFESLPINLPDVDVVIPHQASKLGLQVFKNLYNFKENQIRENLRMNGNCIAASIPLVLCEEIENGRIQRGDLCFITGTSAGFSIGGVLFRY